MDDFSFLDLLWTLLVIYFLFFVLMILFTIVVDIFRSKDLGGFAKALWIIFLVILPLIGALIYLIARHDGMAQRQAEAQKAQKDQFDSYVRETAGASGPADEIARAKGLLDSGAITQEEFDALKAKALA
jgi:ABC-type multidrug transport system fused ATPase/permease subunit